VYGPAKVGGDSHSPPYRNTPLNAVGSLSSIVKFLTVLLPLYLNLIPCPVNLRIINFVLSTPSIVI